ncbi:hypothetical protein RFI_14189 [Reticulomyxa filosa]|uniref:Uncharacterized protein n=1 Tax=Reticulomyxa filosa TaxID=46433 RepID=X6NAF1_RETFI|nr:hypothetical protein RFI_14189 [Reticulomyxa filosa]|eukprot:ETO22996.1 hypothetical protein RFI_14189 [Reticulomyxa filosa]
MIRVCGKIPIVLKRLLEKEKEWMNLREEMKPVWYTQAMTKYYRAHDYRFTVFKSAENRRLQAKNLVNQIKERHTKRKNDPKQGFFGTKTESEITRSDVAMLMDKVTSMQESEMSHPLKSYESKEITLQVKHKRITNQKEKERKRGIRKTLTINYRKNEATTDANETKDQNVTLVLNVLNGRNETAVEATTDKLKDVASGNNEGTWNSDESIEKQLSKDMLPELEEKSVYSKEKENAKSDGVELKKKHVQEMKSEGPGGQQPLSKSSISEYDKWQERQDNDEDDECFASESGKIGGAPHNSEYKEGSNSSRSWTKPPSGVVDGVGVINSNPILQQMIAPLEAERGALPRTHIPFIDYHDVRFSFANERTLEDVLTLIFGFAKHEFSKSEKRAVLNFFFF